MMPAQVKLALQAGATYLPDGGVMGAGAGSVNFWASRKIAASGAAGLLTSDLIGGALSLESGVTFWDAGTLAARLYNGTGVRPISLLDAPLVWLNPAMLSFGDLNLLGVSSPLGSIAPKWMLYGRFAGWTGGQSIMWGDAIYDPQGQSIMWGDSRTTDDTSIMWGDSMTAVNPK
jgi:hypothetical protein